MTTNYEDGSAGAPVGAAELPNLLIGYAAPPPWQVAGVNYAVGIPSGTTLLDPAGISMAGVTVNQTSHIITISASNVTLNGYDFGLAGGWGIVIDAGVTNTVIEDSHFLVGTNENVPVRANPGSGNLTLLDNVFDGGSQTSGAVWGLASYEGSGTFTAEYNSFLNSPEDAIDFNVGTMTTVVKYNLFENLGTSPGAHPDAVQYVGVTSNNSVEEFNTIYQPNPSGMQGVQLQAQGGANLVNTTIDNNVIVAKGPSVEMSYSVAVIQNSGNTISGVNVSNNYIDVTGAYGPFYPPTGSNLVFANNINMKTGAVFANPPNTTTGTTAQNTVASVKALPASGTEMAGDIIIITLTMNEAFTVSGTPVLLLNDGGEAVYTGGSGTDALTFQYNVAATDSPVSSLAVTGVSLPAGTTVTDSSGNAANFAGADTVFSGLSIADPSGPVVAPDSASTQENQPVTIPVLSVDSDPSATLVPSSVAISTAAAHGTTSINATTGAITYTPAAGYYGTDTFQYTVADSLGIVSTPDTVSVSVAAPTGGASGSSGGSGYADGSAAAPAGTPQLPSILSGYVASPPWAVAGVNYAVGVPAGMTLKDPTVAGNLPAGATYNATTHTVTVTGNNVDLSGFNFSLDGGIELVIQSNNVTVQDSLFTVGANQGSLGRVVYVTPSAGNVSFLDNEFNGNNVAVTAQSGQMLMVENAGTFTFDYNYVHNTGGDAVDFGGGPQSDVVEYNLFENIGVNTAHADTLQWYDSQITSGLIAFDTVYQNVPQPAPGNGALTVLSEGPTATMTNMVVENDTIVQTSATSSSGATTGNFATGFYADDGGTASNVTIHDLYIDPTGSDNFTGLWLLPTGYYQANLATPTVVSNVTNMVTGSPSVPSPSSYYAAANGVSPTQSDVVGITASPASGTEMPGNTITFTLTMDEPFTVTGTPALLLNDGGTATYTSGSGTNTLTFKSVVVSTDSPVSSLAITGVSLPSGTSVKDTVGNQANFSGDPTFAGLGIALCFCAGTMIATPDGETLVERLSVGDAVLTLRGIARQIVWIGTGRVLATQGRRNEATPVIVRKGALAENVPHHDLYVTKGHALYIDDVLIPIEELINQRTILWDDRAQEVSIFHIELDSHDVLIANGAPAESYRDDGNRWLFQIANPNWYLPPQAPCAPVVSDGPIVNSVWRRLLKRAGRRPLDVMTDDPDLHLLVDGKRVDSIERRTSGMHVFRLLGSPRSVRLCSRAAVPQDLGLARDPRLLGVAVHRIAFAQARQKRVIEADSAALTDGYHNYEPVDGIRWTNGDAVVPRILFAGLNGPGMLMVELCGATQYVKKSKARQAA